MNESVGDTFDSHTQRYIFIRKSEFNVAKL